MLNFIDKCPNEGDGKGRHGTRNPLRIAHRYIVRERVTHIISILIGIAGVSVVLILHFFIFIIIT
jgi:hypothetical protein